MKAEMGQKLSRKLLAYRPVPAAEMRECGGLGYRRAKKTPAKAPGLELRQYGGKAMRSAYCAVARDRAGGAPADKIREAPDPV